VAQLTRQTDGDEQWQRSERTTTTEQRSETTAPRTRRRWPCPTIKQSHTTEWVRRTNKKKRKEWGSKCRAKKEPNETKAASHATR